MELLDHRQTGPGPLKGLEEQTHRRLHLGVRIEDDTILRVMHKADGHHLLEFPASGAAQDAAPQSCLKHMQFRFAHGALQAQQQAIVEVRGIVQPILIEDERVGQRAQLKQPMPIGGVARQTRHFQTEHDADATQTDFGHQTLEAFSVGRTGAGLSEVAVDHDDPIERPAQRDGALPQRILAVSALGVLEDLAQR